MIKECPDKDTIKRIFDLFYEHNRELRKKALYDKTVYDKLPTMDDIIDYIINKWDDNKDNSVR